MGPGQFPITKQLGFRVYLQYASYSPFVGVCALGSYINNLCNKFALGFYFLFVFDELLSVSILYTQQMLHL